MTTDKFGNPDFYPSKQGGFKWELSSDPNEDRYFRPDETVIDNGDGSFSFASTEGLRPSLVRDTSWDKIGCDMDQSHAEHNGFGWKADTDFRDVEFKFWAKISGGTVDKFMSPEMVTGRHSAEPCCEGSSMGFNFDYNNNPLRIRPFKEQYHSQYAHLDWRTKTELLNAKVSGLGRFVGFGITRFNKTNDQGLASVVIEAWINPDPATNVLNWQRFTVVDDKGGWGDKAKVCNAVNADQILTWAMPVGFRIKLQDPALTFKFKNMSFREIDPFGTPTTDNPTPNTDVGFAELFVKRHINFERVSACTVGGGGGYVELYSQLVQNGDTDLKGTDYRAGEKCKNTSSKFYNKIINDGKIYARKTGSGATLNLRIRKGSDGSIVRTLATIAAASINTSETEIAFTDAGNTYRMQVGDMFSEESDGTSSNYISIYRDDNSTYDGSNSVRFTAKPTTPVEQTGDLKAVINGQL
jgi:hypothetical protein